MDDGATYPKNHSLDSMGAGMSDEAFNRLMDGVEARHANDDAPARGTRKGVQVVMLLGHGLLRKAAGRDVAGKHDVSDEARVPKGSKDGGEFTKTAQGRLDVDTDRPTYASGYLIPREGDEVYKQAPGAFGTPAAVWGQVKGGRVQLLGAGGVIAPSVHGVRPQPLTSEWRVKGDPLVAKQAADSKAANLAKIKAEQDEEAAGKRTFAAARKEHGELTDVKPGDVLQHILGGPPHVVHDVDAFGPAGSDVSQDPRGYGNVGLSVESHRRMTEAEIARLPAAHRRNIAAVRSGAVQAEKDAENQRIRDEEAAAEAAKTQAISAHGTIRDRLGAAKTVQIGALTHGKETYPLYVGVGKQGADVFIKHEGGKEKMPVYMNLNDGVAEVATELQASLDSTPENKGKFKVSLNPQAAPEPPKPVAPKTAAGRPVGAAKVTALLNSYTKGGVHPDALGSWKADGSGYVVTPKARAQYSRDRHATKLAQAMAALGYSTAYGERTIQFSPKLSKGVDPFALPGWNPFGEILVEKGLVNEKPLLVFHGRGDIPKGTKPHFAEDRPAFFTSSRVGAAEYHWNNDGMGDHNGDAVVHAARLHMENPAHHEDLMAAVAATGSTDKDIQAHSQYDGSNDHDHLYVPKVRRKLEAIGHDGYEGPDHLFGRDIPMQAVWHPSQIEHAKTPKNAHAIHPADPV